MRHSLPASIDPALESNAARRAIVLPLWPTSSAAQGVPTSAETPQELLFRGRDEWHTGLSRHLLDLDCSPTYRSAAQCNAVVATLRGNPVAELRLDASRLARRAVDVEATRDDRVQVLWQLAGRGRVRQGPNHALLETARWTVLDPGRDYLLEFEQGARILTMLLPRAQCPGWMPALGLLAARSLLTSGPAHIAMGALSAMLRDVAPLDAESETTLHDSIVALIERALTLELGARGIEAPPERSIQLPQVHAYILDHLAEPGLNVGRLATVFGISRRSLYNLFAPSGVTPHAFIQSAKLDRACNLLHETPARTTSVAGIARQCGFADPAHFSRAFHARHGVAPTTWRLRAT